MQTSTEIIYIPIGYSNNFPTSDRSSILKHDKVGLYAGIWCQVTLGR